MKRTLIITLALALALSVQRHVHVGKNDKLIWTKSPPARPVTPVSYESQQCVLVSRAAFRLQCLCTTIRYIIKAPAGQLPTHPTSAVQECDSCKDDCSR